jgi:hypothetical protein
VDYFAGSGKQKARLLGGRGFHKRDAYRFSFVHVAGLFLQVNLVINKGIDT